MTNLVNIEIDGKTIKVPQGSMIIEAADEANIYIPRFCYHKKLSIAANCRMCLVEVEKSKKPLPACATPVTEGMKVYTHSSMALESQKIVMEFLLINHPLDCPICDQGGECELQDLSMGFGRDHSPFQEGKRSVDDVNIGPLISTNMTRCIHCTRCVRFGTELAGIKELGVTGRGEHAEITTYIEQSLSSEISGNVIDLCPVGALTSKPFRYQARSWELKQVASIAPHDGVGSHVSVDFRREKVLRVLPRNQDEINDCWISDRDRFSYLGLDQERVIQPQIRKENVLIPADWSSAFRYITDGFPKNNLTSSQDEIGAYISPSSTLEEMYLLQKILKGLSSSQMESRIRQSDFSMPMAAGLPFPITELEKQNTFLLLGCNISYEQPLLGMRVRKAVQNGAELFAINPLQYDFHIPVTASLISPPAEMLHHLLGVLKVVQQTGKQLPEDLQTILINVPSTKEHELIAKGLLEKEHSLIFLGAFAQQHTEYSLLYSLANVLATVTNSSIAVMPYGANVVGAEQITQEFKLKPLMLNEKKRVLILFNLEPEFDFHHQQQLEEQLKQADFILAFSVFESKMLNQYANVILPIVPYTENSGTLINLEHRSQCFNSAVISLGDARPGWKVLRVLGNYLNLPGFDYASCEEIGKEIPKLSNFSKSHIPVDFSAIQLHQDLMEQQGLQRISEWPVYRTDALVRRSAALQESPINLMEAIYLNPEQAQQLNLVADEIVVVKQFDYQAKLMVKIDKKVPFSAALIPSAYNQTAALGSINGYVTLHKQIP